MADKILSLNEAEYQRTRRKFKDKGDSFAEIVALDAAVTLTGDVDVVLQAALTNRSSSITTGGTSQELAAANTTRRYLLIQNISSENLWVNFGTTAVADQPSIRLSSGGDLVFEGTFVPTQAVNIVGATTGSKYVAKEG